MSKSSEMILACDFGTTNSLMAAANVDSVIPPIPLDPEAEDPTVLRSILYFPHADEVHFGARAIQEYVNHDMRGRFIRSMKKHLPVRSFVGTWVDDRPFNLETLIGIFLKRMKESAENHFQQSIDSLVLGRPAKFADDRADDNYAQSRLESGARQAGFKNIEFLPEPIAAAREYRQYLDQPRLVLMVDLGGGTSDFTVMKMSQKPFDPSDVLAVSGVPVAGDKFDGALMRYRIAQHFGSEVEYQVPFGSNILKMPRAFLELLCSPADLSTIGDRETREFFENLKSWALDGQEREKIDRLFTLVDDQLGFSVFEEIERTKKQIGVEGHGNFRMSYPSIEIDEQITEKEFAELSHLVREKILKCLDSTLEMAGVTPSEIDWVVCTGGTSRLPSIQEALSQRFDPEKVKWHNFFHAVVNGLADHAQALIRG